MKNVIEGNFLNLIKAIYENSIVDILMYNEKLSTFPLTSERWGLSTYCHLNIVLEALASASRQEKEVKEIQIGKEEEKLSLLAKDMIDYVEN